MNIAVRASEGGSTGGPITDFSAMSSEQIKSVVAGVNVDNIHTAAAIGDRSHGALQALIRSIETNKNTLRGIWSGQASDAAVTRLDLNRSGASDSASKAQALHSNATGTAQSLVSQQQTIAGMPASKAPSAGESVFPGGYPSYAATPASAAQAVQQQSQQAENDRLALVKAAGEMDRTGSVYTCAVSQGAFVRSDPGELPPETPATIGRRGGGNDNARVGTQQVAGGGRLVLVWLARLA